MTKQRKHIRTSKRGKRFVAGSRRRVRFVSLLKPNSRRRINLWIAYDVKHWLRGTRNMDRWLLNKVINILQKNHVQKHVGFQSNFMNGVSVALEEYVVYQKVFKDYPKDSAGRYNWGKQYEAFTEILRIPGVEVHAYFSPEYSSEDHGASYMYELDSNGYIKKKYMPGEGGG